MIRCPHCRSAVRTAYMAFLIFSALIVLYAACAERRTVRLPEVEQQIKFQPDLNIYKFSSCESKLKRHTHKSEEDEGVRIPATPEERDAKPAQAGGTFVKSSTPSPMGFRRAQ